MIERIYTSWTGRLEKEGLPALSRDEIAERAEKYREFGKALFAKGYLSTDANFPELPPLVERDIIDVIWYVNPFRRIWGFRTMASDTVKIPVKSGKIVISAPAEGAAPTETKPTWAAPITLTAKELRAHTLVSDIAVEDAVIDVVADLVKDFGKAMGETEAKNFLNGDGTGSNAENVFVGLLKASGARTVDLAKGQLTADKVLDAVAYFEETLGSIGDLYLFGNPRALRHLRADLINKGLTGYSERILSEYDIQALLGLRDVISTPLIPIRDYSGTDQTKVSDVVIATPTYSAVAGDRRRLTIDRGAKDVTTGLTPYAVSERVAWAIAKPEAIYVIKNALSQ
ncbi:MAG: phage major capsid protein [Candidatus Caldarchaeum sp.]